MSSSMLLLLLLLLLSVKTGKAIYNSTGQHSRGAEGQWQRQKYSLREEQDGGRGVMTYLQHK